jgi:hypothetical protein
MLKKLATFCFVGLLASVTHAATFTSQLNCPVVGGSVCTSTTASYGTVTFSDTATGVNIGIGLGTGLTVQDINFNYTSASVVPITASINGTTVAVTNTPNSVILNGSGNYGFFDVSIPSTGTLTTYGSNFTVNLTTTLTATNIFNSLDTQGNFDFALHLQNCGPNSGTCQPGQTGNNSLVVGEVPGTNSPVPEPTSIALLGTGMAGLAAMLRRRVQSPTI